MKILTSKPLSPDLGLLILRVFSAGFLLTHGWPKLQKVVNGDLSFVNPIGLGSEVSIVLTVIAEVIAPIFLLLGLFTRPVALIIGFTMLVAAFVVHAADPFRSKEMALLYLVISVSLVFTGSGKYSLDKK